MLNQFSRTELLVGAEGMQKLCNARIAVFGIGGVGGYTVEALARSGIGTLDLIDDDKVLSYEFESSDYCGTQYNWKI